MTRHLLTIKTVLIFIFFTSSLFLCQFYGSKSRKFVERPLALHVENNIEAFHVWENEGVKGRILYLFDRRLNATHQGEVVTNSNFIDLALKNGIVREVHHIVPLSAWKEISDTLISRNNFKRSEDTFIMPMPEGRLYVNALAGIRPNSETALVVINSEAWSENEMGDIYNLLTNNTLKSDLQITLLRQKAGVKPLQ